MTPRVIACGGRTYADTAAVWHAMQYVRAQWPTMVLVHGAARGADTLCARWAHSVGCPVESYPADWLRHGRRAGRLRNAYMLSLGCALVVAFPGGAGTAHMVRIARRDGVQVWEVA